MIKKSLFIVLCVVGSLFGMEKKSSDTNQSYVNKVMNYYGPMSITTGGCGVGWGLAVKKPKFVILGTLVAASGAAYNYFFNNEQGSMYSNSKQRDRTLESNIREQK